jgi:predicted nucleic acid-binding protein
VITAIDTNILLDVFLNDLRFGQASSKHLREALRLGAIVACDPVWAETAAVFPEQADFEKAMHTLGVRFLPLTQNAAAEAGGAWKRYRAGGGKRLRMVADFLIGAHALIQCDRLLTRDRGFYRDFFHRLKIVDTSYPSV